MSLCRSCHNCQSKVIMNPFKIVTICLEYLEIIPENDNKDCYRYDSEGNYYE